MNDTNVFGKPNLENKLSMISNFSYQCVHKK
jgi:hypothetical protein